jgi:hypothetical protein
LVDRRPGGNAYGHYKAKAKDRDDRGKDRDKKDRDH